MTKDTSSAISPPVGQRLALRRAERGTLYQRDGAFFSAGRLAPGWMMPHLSTLLESGHLRRVIRRYPTGVSVRIELSEAGRQRLSELDHEWQRGISTDTPRLPRTPIPTKERTTVWWHWTLPAIVGLYVIGRVIVNLFDRPTLDIPSRLRQFDR